MLNTSKQQSSGPGSRRRPSLVVSAAVALIVLGSGGTASAQVPQVIANFMESTGEPFTFTYTGSGATFTGSAQINFVWTAASGLPTGNQAALVTLTAGTTTPGTLLGNQLDQPINIPGETIKVTRVSDGANLITATFIGDMYGNVGGYNATLQGINNLGPQKVSFTSDFYNFAGTTNQSFQFDLASITPTLSQAANGYAANFTSDAFGSFSISPVPEPASAGLTAIGLLGLGTFTAIRRRRTTARAMAAAV